MPIIRIMFIPWLLPIIMDISILLIFSIIIDISIPPIFSIIFDISVFPIFSDIIMFELTILFTGLFGFAGVLFHTHKSRRRLSPAYRESFSVDRYGVFVPGQAGSEAVENIMRDTGAVAVEQRVEA